MIKRKTIALTKAIMCCVLVFTVIFGSSCNSDESDKPAGPTKEIDFTDELPRVQADENVHFTMETVDEG